MSIGLKGFWKNHKGSSLKWTIKDLRWEIRYAFRRAWDGYDDRDIFDLGFKFFERMPVLLREFKNHNIGMWYDKEAGRQLDKKATDEVIDQLIEGFELCNEDKFLEKFDNDDVKTQYKALEEHREQTIQLFSKWCTALWY